MIFFVEAGSRVSVADYIAIEEVGDGDNVHAVAVPTTISKSDGVSLDNGETGEKIRVTLRMETQTVSTVAARYFRKHANTFKDT